MTRRMMLAFLLALFAWGPSAAVAQDGDGDSGTGEVHIKMNKDYAKVLVNGEEWEETEFTDNGMTVIVRKLPLDSTTKITLRPSKSGFSPVELVVEGKEFKQEKKSKGKVRFVTMVARRTVKFEPAAEQPVPPAPVEEPTAPEEE